jgi:hypothetical protein
VGDVITSKLYTARIYGLPGDLQRFWSMYGQYFWDDQPRFEVPLWDGEETYAIQVSTKSGEVVEITVPQYFKESDRFRIQIALLSDVMSNGSYRFLWPVGMLDDNAREWTYERALLLEIGKQWGFTE